MQVFLTGIKYCPPLINLRTLLRTKADEVPETPFFWGFLHRGDIRILSPRFFIATSRAGPATGTAVGSLLTNSRFHLTDRKT